LSDYKNVSPEFLQECLRDICRIGVKYAGTPGEVKARDYLINKLRDLDLDDISTEEFNYLSYTPVSGKLEVISAGGESIKCEPLQNTGNKSAQGEVVFVGDGSEEDFMSLEKKGVSIKGKIVITSTPFPFLVYPIAETKGAAGLIIITDPPGGLIRSATALMERREGTIPGVTISLDGGKHLLELMGRAKVKVYLESMGVYSWKKSWNVIARIRGILRPREKIVVCSHYDSQIKGEHAWDNSSGDAGLLEIARLLAGSKTRRTIELIFFGAEEQGLWGSTAYCEARSDEMKCTKAIINLDGFSSSLCPENFLETTPDIREYSTEIAEKLKWPVHHCGDPMPLSDHVPFIKAGVPAIWIHEGLIDPYYHTECDVFEHIDIEKLSKITTVAAAYAIGLANFSNLPF
jgi:aminopeptidase YwaD